MSDTLYIDNWSSQCGNCRKSADPKEKGHFNQLGYGKDNGKPGCGIIWKTLSSNYFGMKDACTDMRPDLTWIGD